jgi:aryl-alcohol dehydrogenase-like predicted oxidoreductase
MKIKVLGSNQLEVSAIGLGCWGMSGAYGEGNDLESIATIQTAFNSGVTFFDTADVYGNGHNESLVGKAIEGIRDEIVLATKFGFRNDQYNELEICGKPDYVKKACEASLKRLNTDVIDLYYLHRWDKSVPIEETVGAMSRLIDEGKVKHIGLSEVSLATLKKANETFPITALQSEYSLITRDIETDILPYCIEHQIGVIPFCPLGRSMLTGSLQNVQGFEKGDYRANMPRFQGQNFEHNKKVIQEFIKFAEDKSIKPAQLALAWLLHQGDQIVPIPGMKTGRHLPDNLKSVDVQLSEGDLVYLNTIVSQIIGERYPASNKKYLED